MLPLRASSSLVAPSSGGWAAPGLVAAADPVACRSQRPHSSLGAEGAIVPVGGWWGQWGVSTQKEGMRLEKLPPGLQSPDRHQISIGTPSRPRALSPVSSQKPSRLSSEWEPRSAREASPHPPLLLCSKEPFLGLGAVQHLGS